MNIYSCISSLQHFGTSLLTSSADATIQALETGENLASASNYMAEALGDLAETSYEYHWLELVATGVVAYGTVCVINRLVKGFFSLKNQQQFEEKGLAQREREIAEKERQLEKDRADFYRRVGFRLQRNDFPFSLTSIWETSVGRLKTVARNSIPYAGKVI